MSLLPLVVGGGVLALLALAGSDDAKAAAPGQKPCKHPEDLPPGLREQAIALLTSDDPAAIYQFADEIQDVCPDLASTFRDAADVLREVQNLPSGTPSGSVTRYTIKPGDNPYALAQKFGTTTQAIFDANPTYGHPLVFEYVADHPGSVPPPHYIDRADYIGPTATRNADGATFHYNGRNFSKFIPGDVINIPTSG